MSILEELLSKLSKLPIDEQVKQICDKITEEEKSKIEHNLFIPKGPNIFLALEVSEQDIGSFSFLCLERESEGKYIISLRNFSKKRIKNENEYARKVKVWDLREDKTERILSEYARKYKYLNGDV